MNSTKRAHLRELNRKHDEAHSSLVAAQRKLNEAKSLELGQDVVARLEGAVTAKRAELEGIEAEREPLQRELERTTTRIRTNIGFALSVVAFTGSLPGILNALSDFAHWLLTRGHP